ncbi:MAG: ferredoxin [Solirubrobacteraceae bacterium]|nr:ferredoxin [Solirubrobacteraceae bacterium]
MSESAVEVDAHRCEAIGFCVQVAPTVFTLVDGPPVSVASRELSDDEVDAVAEAQDLCPAQAILLRG